MTKNNLERVADFMHGGTHLNEMTSRERVRNAILGKPVDRTPVYGWVSANLGAQLTAAYGSIAAFEDKYRFDAAHIFGGPSPFKHELLKKIRLSRDEFTPELLTDADFFTNPDCSADYDALRRNIAFHKERSRFCYVQTPGFFENFNEVFGIEEQLLFLALYPDELGELYRRQAEWTVKYADRCIEAGADMIHVSDDWGVQGSLMFSPATWRRLIKPCLKRVANHVHSRGSLISLHSDGCISDLLGEIAEIGIDCVHPWQESANMPYSLWLENFSDRFAILGGVCIQTALGFGDYEHLEREIRRVFSLLKNKRWICCTTHFVQEHCSVDELEFAFELIRKLA